MKSNALRAAGQRAWTSMMAAIALSSAPIVHGQAMMVGADGAIHLDASQTVNANQPVIIEQSPTILQPGVVSAQPGAVWQTPMVGGVPCPTPMAYAPAAVAVAPEQPKENRLAIYGDFLYLHPTGVDLAHAQQQNGIGGAGTVPFGTIGVTDFHHEPGVRVGGAFGLSPCTSIGASYTWFESSAVGSLSAPIIPGGGGAVGSLVHHPGAAITASLGPVNATSDIDFQMADGEFRGLIVGDQCFSLAGTVGLRYAHLEQRFTQTGVFSGGSAGVIVTNTNIDFDGGGAKVGLHGNRKLGNTGFSIYGRTNVSPLVGQFKSTYTMRNDTTAVLLAQADWSDDRFMTILDYEFGLAWTGPRGHLRLAAGYMASHWFNAVTTGEFINAVQTNNYLDVSDTISFDGPTARVEVFW